MARRQREREEKYDVGPDFVLPDLAGLAPAGTQVEHVEVHLDSLYFDTADRALLRNRVTLRRRAGDEDTGWQLKVPEGKARSEIRLDAPPGERPPGETPPGELVDLVAGVAGGHGLEPAAQITTRRDRHRVVAPGGETIVEVADDHVHASAFGDAVTVSAWREVEVELGSGDEKLLATIGRRLARAGAQPSPSPSKLARALEPASEPSRTASRVRSRRPAGAKHGTAGAALRGYLGQQHAAMVTGDVALRRGEDPIHATRVATRRLRSTLRTFAPLFDDARAGALDEELAWYAQALGEVRDRQVQRKRFAAALDAVAPELLLGPVRAAVEERLLSEQLRRRAALDEALASQRYRDLLAEVARWAADPPLTATGSLKAVERLAGKARRRSDKRLATALAAVEDGRSDADVENALHRARKAAKRARYATELTRPAVGKKKAAKAKKVVKRYKQLQDLLGDHQDSVVAAEVLAGLGKREGVVAGANGFTYGLLYGREEAAAARVRRVAVERYL